MTCQPARRAPFSVSARHATSPDAAMREIFALNRQRCRSGRLATRNTMENT